MKIGDVICYVIPLALFVFCLYVLFGVFTVVTHCGLEYNYLIDPKVKQTLISKDKVDDVLNSIPIFDNESLDMTEARFYSLIEQVVDARLVKTIYNDNHRRVEFYFQIDTSTIQWNIQTINPHLSEIEKRNHFPKGVTFMTMNGYTFTGSVKLLTDWKDTHKVCTFVGGQLKKQN